MEITYFRSSSYSCWSLCQMQYYIRYVLGIPDKSNLRAEIGTTTHKILEILAKQKLQLQLNKDPLDIKDDSLSTYIPVKDIFSDENVESILNSVYKYYSEKSEFTYTNKEYKTVTKYVNSALNFQNGIFDPRKQKIVSPETYFDFPIERDWARLPNGEYLRVRGTMDLVTEIKQNEIYELIDYKTGKLINFKTGIEKQFEDFVDDFQLNLYYWSLYKLYPNIKQFIVTIYYIQYNKPITLCFDKSHILKTEQMMKSRMEEIQTCIKPTKLNTWFCSKVCTFGKNLYNETNTTICNNIYNKLLINGITKTTKEEKEHLFNLDYYEAPG